MCETCAKHWQEVDLETGELVPGKKEPPPPIIESGCNECQRFYGWTLCRSGQYKNPRKLVDMGDQSFLVVAEYDDNLLVLGRFADPITAEAAFSHIY